VNETGSRSQSLADFGITGVESLVPVTKQIVN
jgi:hypothetical protein